MGSVVPGLGGMFQSRKRFRHCWSAHITNGTANWYPVSIAKAIPSLLERGPSPTRRRYKQVSIAKAIPSLLERRRSCKPPMRNCSFNRESDSVTVGAGYQPLPVG